MIDTEMRAQFYAMVKENIKNVIADFRPTGDNERDNRVFQQKAQRYYYNVIGLSSNDIWLAIEKIADEIFPDTPEEWLT